MGIGFYFGLAIVLIVVIGFINWKLSGSKRIYEPWYPRSRRNNGTSVGLAEKFNADNINHNDD